MPLAVREYLRKVARHRDTEFDVNCGDVVCYLCSMEKPPELAETAVEIHCEEANVRSAAVPRKLGYVLDRIDNAIEAPGETGRSMIWVRLAADARGHHTDQLHRPQRQPTPLGKLPHRQACECCHPLRPAR